MPRLLCPSWRRSGRSSTTRVRAISTPPTRRLSAMSPEPSTRAERPPGSARRASNSSLAFTGDSDEWRTRGEANRWSGRWRRRSSGASSACGRLPGHPTAVRHSSTGPRSTPASHTSSRGASAPTGYSTTHRSAGRRDASLRTSLWSPPFPRRPAPQAAGGAPNTRGKGIPRGTRPERLEACGHGRRAARGRRARPRAGERPATLRRSRRRVRLPRSAALVPGPAQRSPAEPDDLVLVGLLA